VINVLHASDLHFGEPFRAEVGEAFARQAAQMAPDLIIISGDLTQRAKVGEYEQARAFLDRLPAVPRVVTPGNHDVPLYRFFERMFDPYRNYKTYIAEDLDTVTRLPGAVIVALNSAAPHTAITNGRIRDHQIRLAADVFSSAAADEARIIVSHHHFAPAPDYEGDTQLPRAKEILEAFSDMGVELIFGGHLHRAYIGNSLDVHPGRDRQHGVIIVQSGTTTSRRGRAREQAKNSFNTVRIAAQHVEITHYMYFEETQGFRPFSTHAFPRRESRWFTFDPFRVGLPADEPKKGSVGAEPGRVA
jgi:3',5'-cyclic AMP phosphodiesterase CpdA